MNNFVISSYDTEKRLLNIAINAERTHWSIYALYRTFLLMRSNKTRCCSPSFNYLVKRLGMSRPTLSRCVKILEEHGFIFIIKRGKKSNIYFTPLEDYYLNPEKLHGYAEIIESFDGNLMAWNKYCKKFLN